MNQTVFPGAEPPKHSGRDWSYSDKTGWSGSGVIDPDLYEDEEEVVLGSDKSEMDASVYARKEGGGFLVIVALRQSDHNVAVANLSSLLALLTLLKPLTEVKRAAK